jgi:transposase
MWRFAMSRRQKNPLRVLTEAERQQLEHLARAHTAPAAQVARAKVLLAVASGQSYTQAACLAGRCSGDAVATLVARFNAEGLSAVQPRHGGGPPLRYGAAERERILAEVHRPPDREQDGAAVWSLSLLQRALRRNGLPSVSSATIWEVLHEAGLTWQKQRSWCDTGLAQRRRKQAGQTVVVTIADPDAEAKKKVD